MHTVACDFLNNACDSMADVDYFRSRYFETLVSDVFTSCPWCFAIAYSLTGIMNRLYYYIIHLTVRTRRYLYATFMITELAEQCNSLRLMKV